MLTLFDLITRAVSILFFFKSSRMSFFAPRTASNNKTTNTEKADLLKKSQPWVEK